MLEPCRNLRIGSVILARAYRETNAIFPKPRLALWHAISAVRENLVLNVYYEFVHGTRIGYAADTQLCTSPKIGRSLIGVP
jgi:hypothetical protein